MERKKVLLRQTAGRAVVRPVMSTNIYAMGQVADGRLSPCGRGTVQPHQTMKATSTTRQIGLEAKRNYRLPFVMPSKVETYTVAQRKSRQ
jgi:hypothetical protein